MLSCVLSPVSLRQCHYTISSTSFRRVTVTLQLSTRILTSIRDLLQQSKMVLSGEKYKKTEDELFKDSCRKPKAQLEVSEKQGKKRHRDCSFCILDFENSPILDFPTNEEVVGVITMEDVIEELLQEEILDETDEYVNRHNMIRVNMHASQQNLPSVTSVTQSSSGSTSPNQTSHLATLDSSPTAKLSDSGYTTKPSDSSLS